MRTRPTWAQDDSTATGQGVGVGQVSWMSPRTFCAWSRPARADAARRAGSSTFLPMARSAAASGLITTDCTPGPSLASWLSARPALSRVLVRGARTTTWTAPLARSALAGERTPPSMYVWPSTVTGGHTSGTAQTRGDRTNQVGAGVLVEHLERTGAG